ncbi:MAG: hypothetical protein OZ922_01985 [Myxococcales bacterium]|nr:hypothetical protein [Myxococcales bacterium]
MSPRSFAAMCSLVLAVVAYPVGAVPVRVFAVGNEVRVEDVVSVQAFRDKMFHLVDATLPNRSDFVQAGVDDVVSHIQPADPGAPTLVLVNFPEDVGLVAGMTGSRGAQARSSISTGGAFLTLLNTHASRISYYRSKFQGLETFQALLLALTDLNYRVVYETFRDIAVTYGVYVSAGVNVANARRIEAADDPLRVSKLRDPDEPWRPYAYEAIAPEVHNTTMIFRPDGEVMVPDGNGGVVAAPSETGGILRGSIDKSYLVPLELDLLSLAPSPVHALDVLDTALGRLGVVISKDAWMVDVNERYDAKRANLLIQSEAFSAWAFSDSGDGPDVMKEGGFGALQRFPNLLYNVTPALVGNLIDVTFDGQSSILGKRTGAFPGPLSSANAWIGHNPDTGFLAIAPWVIPDPGIANPLLTQAERRAQLTAVGDLLTPKSPVLCPTTLTVGACRGGYRENVVFADVDTPGARVLGPVDPGPRAPTAFGANVQVNAIEGSPVTQRHPRAAAANGRLYVVWDDDRDGYENVYMAISNDGGATFGGEVKISGNVPGAIVELFPQITVAAKQDRVYVVWQEFAAGRNDDAGRIMLARFDLAGTKLGPDVRVDSGGDGFGKWTPQVVADPSGNPAVVWIDERDSGPGGVQFEHVYFASSRDLGSTFRPSARLDDVGVRRGAVPDPLAVKLDNRWRPTVAIRNRSLFVAWADFRNYNWDIYATRASLAQKRPRKNVRVDDFPAFERLNTDPTVVVDAKSGAVSVAWTDIRARQTDSNIFFAQATKRNMSAFQASRRLDDSWIGFDPDVDTPSTQSHPDMKMLDRTICVAWQDDRGGTNDVYFKRSTDGGATFSADERVDDTGAGVSAQTAPAVAIDATGGGRCYVVWEDTRNGNSDVFVASRSVP